jgi:hypothetical protein
MVDREDFEDLATIDEYLNAVPPPDISYRARLRAQLATSPVVRRRWWQQLRLPWSVPVSAGLAAAVALALLLFPFGPGKESPLNPKAVLARAVAMTSSPVPYRGTSETTFLAQPNGAPAATAKDLGRHEIISRWAVRDMTHWRVDIQIAQPALQSERQVAAADGSSVVWYRSLTNRAVRIPLSPPQLGAFLLSSFEGGRGLPLTETLGQYLEALNNPTTHTHARTVGQETVLGRTTDVVEVWPVMTTTTGTGACRSAGPCPQQSKTVSYGRARMWIDRQYGLLLRYRETGLPAGASGAAQNLLYRVTSVSFGHRPNSSQLSYQPPVKPVTVHSGPGVTHSGGGGGFGYPGASSGWHAPPGFISAGPPADRSSNRYLLSSNGQSEDSLSHVISVYAVFRLHGPQTGGPFVYVQEQYRATGLPASLTRGHTVSAGHCSAYTGIYRDGLHWIVLAARKVSLLAVSNDLRASDLPGWIATQVCR